MTDDLASRDALRELLFDEVAPPPGSEAMFAATFAATGSEGADLLPPDHLFDDPAPDDLPDDDPALDDPGVDPGVDTAEVPEDLPVDAEQHADRPDPTPDPGDPGHDADPGSGW